MHVLVVRVKTFCVLIIHNMSIACSLIVNAGIVIGLYWKL